MQLGDCARLVDGVRADAGEDAHLAGAPDGLCELADGHWVLGVVKERGLDASGGQRLGQDVAHATAGPQALHVLGARDEVRAVLGHPGEVDQLRGEEALEAVLLAELVDLLGEIAKPFTIEI